MYIKSFHVELDELSQAYVTKRIKQNNNKNPELVLPRCQENTRDNLCIYFICTKCFAYMNECAHACRTLRGPRRASCLVELETKWL